MSESKERIVRVTLEEAKRMKSRTDYARLDAMTDEDIARAVANPIPREAPVTIAFLPAKENRRPTSNLSAILVPLFCRYRRLRHPPAD